MRTSWEDNGPGLLDSSSTGTVAVCDVTGCGWSWQVVGPGHRRSARTQLAAHRAIAHEMGSRTTAARARRRHEAGAEG